MNDRRRKYLALSGGVGGAKLAVGLVHVLGPEQLTIVANTADDFEHLGLHVSPDLDSVMYALAGLDDPERGWGIVDETWSFMGAIEKLGGPTWFNLGDKDIGTHVLRTQALRNGQSLSEITASLCRELGIKHRLLPMSNDPVRTQVETDEGVLPFQDYFVRRQCEPRVSGFRFQGIEDAEPHPEFAGLMSDQELAGIIVCPSNPYVSVDPILNLRGVRKAMMNSPAPVVAVSPIVGGNAIKGPAAKMMAELGQTVNSASVAAYYQGLLDAIVIDRLDSDHAGAIEKTGVRAVVTDTVMRSVEDKMSLARRVIDAMGNS